MGAVTPFSVIGTADIANDLIWANETVDNVFHLVYCSMYDPKKQGGQ